MFRRRINKTTALEHTQQDAKPEELILCPRHLTEQMVQLGYNISKLRINIENYYYYYYYYYYY
jgi:hypothetical protein